MFSIEPMRGINVFSIKPMWSIHARGDRSLSQQKTQLKAACGAGCGNWCCGVMEIFVGN